MAHEYVGHFHIHTRYSDGAKLHRDIASAAINAGIDFVVITDHNVWVDDVEGYYTDNGNKVLLLVGEEVHDPRRLPQSNHLLIAGTDRELASQAQNPQKLIDTVNESDGGLCILAHPFEVAAGWKRMDGLGSINWQDWSVTGYHGLEIWNYMSEFKSHITGPLAAVRAAFNPDRYITGPFSEAIEKWDSLLTDGDRISAICGGDIHAGTYKLGPLQRTLFPYEFHFRSLNNHILTPKPLSDNLSNDRKLILNALRRGSCWIGYDRLASTSGFRFSARSRKYEGTMGDNVRITNTVTLQILTPEMGHIQLIHNGKVINEVAHGQHLMHQTNSPGYYRVQVFKRFKGKKRGWIFSNPIYLVPSSHS